MFDEDLCQHGQRKELLLFMFHHKECFFCPLPLSAVALALPLQTSSSVSAAATTAASVSVSGTAASASAAAAASAAVLSSRTKEEDKEFAATLSFYFYQCLYDDDLELRLRALLCWGQLLAGAAPGQRQGQKPDRGQGGDLTEHARDLLVLQVKECP